MHARTIIEVKNLRRTFRSVKKEEGLRGSLNLLLKPKYAEHTALKGVSFSIEEGAFIGLIGANGAGKTTLLKILSGLIPPSEGEAKVLGFTPFERPVTFRKSISLVMGQKAQLWWDLPAVDAFDLIRAIYNISDDLYKKRLKELSELLSVEKLLHTQIRRLSLGERMKMELIGAILHWPSVIFLDEPTIGLDVLAAHKLRAFLKEHNRKERATIILTSHNMDDIEQLCSRVLILKEGELIYDGNPGGLTKKGEQRLRVRLMQNISTGDLAKELGMSQEKIESEDDETPAYLITLHQDQLIDILQKLINKFTIIELGIEGQSLESVIQRLYESGARSFS